MSAADLTPELATYVDATRRLLDLIGDLTEDLPDELDDAYTAACVADLGIRDVAPA